MRRQLPCDSCAREGKVQVANYRCPACARCSCSLSCVKSHKANYNCTGIRDKTAPVPKRNYDEHNLISDYALLEEAKRQKENAKRNRINNKFIHLANMSNLFDPIPRYKQRIMGQEAAKRGIDLRFMPSVFCRHKNNTSHVKPVNYSPQQQRDTARRPFEKIMVWRVDLHFCGPNGGTRLVQIHHLDEEVNMADVLERAIHTLEIRKEPRLNGDTDQYLLYAGMSGSKLRAYIRNDTDLGRRETEPSILPDLPRHKRRKLNNTSADPNSMDLDTRGFIPIDTDKTLRESLRGALVVEYPILFVAPKGSADDQHLQNATKSLFAKPEPEVDDTFPPPLPSTTAVKATCGPTDGEHPGIRITDTTHSQTALAGSTYRSGQKSAADSPRGSGGIAQKASGEARRVTGPEVLTTDAVDSESQGREQQRKAEESGDSDTFRSELEANLTGHLTPRKTNGGKTGYTRDGKLRVSESQKPSPIPLSLPSFRSALPPGDHDDEGTKTQEDVDGIATSGEADDLEAEESVQSDSGNEHESVEVEDGNVNGSLRGEGDDEGEEDGQTLKTEAVGEAEENDRESEDDEKKVCRGFYRSPIPLLGTI
ncbi:Box C/D snoRNA protein 1 [Gracilariopsis chorda]|uniref:Box C/D snoRNA protein 1 n=1 Tax=Gracilariopsis chorda TaxID=448386 RepID=A0A2V3IJ14_9FLOR|nr:Box C/D snoRNA protein 1 [Gracilariopsis chorda]|eukprot:PXF42049.1 Box C/D snoRNA protein 1 [Gracilariopsis chorda]